MADIIIASEKAQFGQPEITLGLIPGGGGTQRLLRLIGKARTMELCLTGNTITAEDALKWGLINTVAKHEELMATAAEIAEKIAKHFLPILKMLKKNNN